MDHFSNDEKMRSLIAKARDGCVESQNDLLNSLRSYLQFVAEKKMESKLKLKMFKSQNKISWKKIKLQPCLLDTLILFIVLPCLAQKDYLEEEMTLGTFGI